MAKNDFRVTFIFKIIIRIQNGSARTHLDQKRQINITVNSNPSTSNKLEAAMVRKRCI